MSARMIMKNDYSKRSMPLNWGVSKSLTTSSVDLEMPASRALIFGNPVAGTKLMQKDIAISLDLPLRLAIVDKDGQTMLIHQTTEDYCGNYRVENHPVLEKIESLFAALALELSK